MNCVTGMWEHPCDFLNATFFFLRETGLCFHRHSTPASSIYKVGCGPLWDFPSTGGDGLGEKERSPASCLCSMYPSKKKKNCLCSRRPVPVPIPDSPLPPLRLPRSELAASRLPPASALGASPSALPACIRAPPRRALSHTRCFRARSLHRTQPPIPVRRPAVCRRAPRPALHQQPSCSHQLHREPSHRPTTKRSTQVDHPVLNS